MFKKNFLSTTKFGGHIPRMTPVATGLQRTLLRTQKHKILLLPPPAIRIDFSTLATQST